MNVYIICHCFQEETGIALVVPATLLLPTLQVDKAWDWFFGNVIMISGYS